MTNLEAELKSLIVSALGLKDVKPEDVSSTDPLFGDGLGLDSVDALELAIAIHKNYGVKISADDPKAREAFESVTALARYIGAHEGQAT
jgi:acyl carrier protein